MAWAVGQRLACRHVKLGVHCENASDRKPCCDAALMPLHPTRISELTLVLVEHKERVRGRRIRHEPASKAHS